MTCSDRLIASALPPRNPPGRRIRSPPGWPKLEAGRPSRSRTLVSPVIARTARPGGRRRRGARSPPPARSGDPPGLAQPAGRLRHPRHALLHAASRRRGVDRDHRGPVLVLRRDRWRALTGRRTSALLLLTARSSPRAPSSRWPPAAPSSTSSSRSSATRRRHHVPALTGHRPADGRAAGRGLLPHGRRADLRPRIRRLFRNLTVLWAVAVPRQGRAHALAPAVALARGLRAGQERLRARVNMLAAAATTAFAVLVARKEGLLGPHRGRPRLTDDDGVTTPTLFEWAGGRGRLPPSDRRFLRPGRARRAALAAVPRRGQRRPPRARDGLVDRGLRRPRRLHRRLGGYERMLAHHRGLGITPSSGSGSRPS